MFFGFVVEVVVGGCFLFFINGEKDFFVFFLVVFDVGSDFFVVGLDVGVGIVVFVVYFIVVVFKVGIWLVGFWGVLGGGFVEEINGNIVEFRSIIEGGKFWVGGLILVDIDFGSSKSGSCG